MTIEINGMAHVILTVSRFEVAREFYRKLLPEFGMKPVFDGDKLFYCVGARTAIGIEPCDPALAGERFVQQRVGLHHLCLRARSREDVDRCAADRHHVVERLRKQQGEFLLAPRKSRKSRLAARSLRRVDVEYREAMPVDLGLHGVETLCPGVALRRVGPDVGGERAARPLSDESDDSGDPDRRAYGEPGIVPARSARDDRGEDDHGGGRGDSRRERAHRWPCLRLLRQECG